MRKLNIRRMVSAALAVLLVMSLTVGAFAAEIGIPTDRPDLAIIAAQFVNWDGTQELPNLNELSEEDQELVKAMVNAAMVASEAEAQTGAQTEDGTEAQTEAIPIETETAPVTDDELLPAVTGFSDVPSTHGFYTAIMDCAAKGITSGYADGTFRPTNSVTRAQFCVMLSRAFYPDEVKKYDTDVYKKQGWFVPNTRALYMAGVLKDTSFVSGFATPATMDQVINRYDMARLMTNIMANKGFSATSAQKTEAQKTEAQKKIADYKNIPAKYQDAVKNVFALGIITGYSNGTFGGNNVMNRGQGCVVIYRMMKYTPATTPGGSGTGDTTYDDGKTPGTGTGNTGNTGGSGTGNTGNTGSTTQQPETPAAKTLSNGKPVTEANVLALLNELKAKYPECSNFGRTGYPAGANSIDARTAIRKYPNSQGGYTSTTAGCGGWAALVSDYIFGQTGFPARQVNYKDTRPGDIIIELNSNNRVMHVLIATSRPYHDPECENTKVHTTSSSGGTTADPSGYEVYWTGNEILAYDDGFMPGQVVVWTRYPS